MLACFGFKKAAMITRENVQFRLTNVLRIVTCSHCQTSYNFYTHVHLNGATLKRAYDRLFNDDKEQVQRITNTAAFFSGIFLSNIFLLMIGEPYWEELDTEFRQFVSDFVRETVAQVVGYVWNK
jgi:hypothetical protein